MSQHHNIQSGTDRQTQPAGNINNIITFNGQGCSGKTKQAKRLVKTNPERYQYRLGHSLRDNFTNKVYKQLGRKDERIQYPDGRCQSLYEVEVLGIPSLAWLTAYFHLSVKPLLERGTIVVLDHYLGDYCADMFSGADIETFRANIENLRCFVGEHLAIPTFEQGTHFYLDIDYEIYKERWCKREGTEPQVPECIFKERRERYQELCELEYLIPIDSAVCKSEVAREIQAVLRRSENNEKT